MHQRVDEGDCADDDARAYDGDEPLAQRVGICRCQVENGKEPAAAHADTGDDLETIDKPDNGDV